LGAILYCLYIHLSCTEIFARSLHDALPILDAPAPFAAERGFVDTYGIAAYRKGRKLCQIADITADRGSLERLVEICNREGLSLRSEEHTSELQSRFDLVCRLLLEKK